MPPPGGERLIVQCRRIHPFRESGKRIPLAVIGGNFAFRQHAADQWNIGQQTADHPAEEIRMGVEIGAGFVPYEPRIEERPGEDGSFRDGQIELCGKARTSLIRLENGAVRDTWFHDCFCSSAAWKASTNSLSLAKC